MKTQKQKQKNILKQMVGVFYYLGLLLIHINPNIDDDL
jgi:hypothetical protein